MCSALSRRWMPLGVFFSAGCERRRFFRRLASVVRESFVSKSEVIGFCLPLVNIVKLVVSFHRHIETGV